MLCGRRPGNCGEEHRFRDIMQLLRIKHTAGSKTRIPAQVFNSQIYFSITLSCFPIHMCSYSKRLLTYHITTTWGLQCKANGVIIFVNKDRLSQNSSLPGKYYPLSFKKRTNGSALLEEAWSWEHNDREASSGFVWSWQDDIPSQALIWKLQVVDGSKALEGIYCHFPQTDFKVLGD